MTHTYTTVCDPHTLFQVASCHDEHHPSVARELTDIRLFYCNCGYSSGWVPKEELPEPVDFIREHLPPGVEWPTELDD